MHLGEGGKEGGREGEGGRGGGEEEREAEKGFVRTRRYRLDVLLNEGGG